MLFDPIINVLQTTGILPLVDLVLVSTVFQNSAINVPILHPSVKPLFLHN